MAAYKLEVPIDRLRDAIEMKLGPKRQDDSRSMACNIMGLVQILSDQTGCD